MPNANLVAVADMDKDLAQSSAQRLNASNWYTTHHDLLSDSKVDAILVVSSTSTHKEIVIDAAAVGKNIFCEKPLSISLDEALTMKAAIDKKGNFFQMGFQRRFDKAYMEAKKKLDAGVIGDPVLFKGSSRDPFRPSLEYADPKHSGGLIIDMGIHDFDAARMFMGDVKSVYSVGGTLAYPEMKSINDIDNAVINMYFESSALGVVDLSRNGVYGYDIRAEILGTKGALKAGYLMDSPLLVMTKEGVTHDVVPYFMQRFEQAYLTQLQNFVDNVLQEKEPPITIDDGVAALKVAVAATKSYKQNRPVELNEI